MLDGLIDGRRGASIDPAARALHYADGLFETLLRVDGRLPFWPWHQARLCFGLRACGLREPDWTQLLAELQGLAADHDDCVLKLILAAPAGGRGYGRTWPVSPMRILQAHALPAPLACVRAASAVDALGLGPSPRGLKRLAMVDQVRAQSAAEAAGADTALLRDRLGRPVGFSQGSLWVRQGHDWLTPPIASGALGGVGRAWLLWQLRGRARVSVLSQSQLLAADEVVFANAVRGPLPVAELDGQPLSCGTALADLASRWRRQARAADGGSLPNLEHGC